MATTGQKVRVVAVHGGWGIRRRLAEMGLNPGETIRVVQSDMSGPMVVAVRGSRLALGRGMAHRIEVSPS